MAKQDQDNLNSRAMRDLVSYIKDSFRVRRNHDPLYVDLSNNFDRISAAQHQVVFGRRGSGKSCLFVYFLNRAPKSDTLAIYILADEFKRLTYPDILIRLLIELFESVPVKYRWLKKLIRRPVPTLQRAKELRRLLDLAEEAEITEGRTSTLNRGARAGAAAKGLDASVSTDRNDTLSRTSQFTEQKLDTLERYLRDYKNALIDARTTAGSCHSFVLLDDFYLLPRNRHPDILDYLHRLLRDTDYYLKIATIRHRTELIRNHPQTIGVELSQDVEEISLDRTLEDLEGTQSVLGKMLDSIATEKGVSNILTTHFNPDALQSLTLSSGGVPRDFLNIFINAIESAVEKGDTKWLTPRHIYKGAGRLAYQSKLKHLRDDASSDASGLERLLTDLLEFCLKEKRKTAFLISQEEAQKQPREHDLIQQLMDFKLIHVVEPDTSAASGRPGRYEAYTLDFSLFMEPRRRGIEIIEFWKIDDQRRRTGIREAPVFPLERAGRAFDNVDAPSDPNRVLEETATNDSDAGESAQPSLFKR